MKSPTRGSDVFLTALAPMTWGTTYAVATELLPSNHPLTVAALRALTIGLMLIDNLNKNYSFDFAQIPYTEG